MFRYFQLTESLHWQETASFSESSFPASATFTTLKVSRGTPPIDLKAHYDRLFGQSNGPLPWTALISFQEWTASFIETEVTHPQILRISQLESGEVIVTLRPYQSIESVSLKTVQFDRPNPLVKQHDYAQEVQALERAQTEGFTSILRLNTSGHIAESAYANVFWINSEGAIYTPHPKTVGCLPGIARERVVKMLREEGKTVIEGAFCLSDLKHAVSGFLSNAVHGVVPISQVDDMCWNTQIASGLRRLFDNTSLYSYLKPQAGGINHATWC